MLQLSLARELGCSLAELTAKVSQEELLLWNTFYQIEQETADKQRRQRGR
jgi:hypothetical protein